MKELKLQKQERMLHLLKSLEDIASNISDWYSIQHLWPIKIVNFDIKSQLRSLNIRNDPQY